MSIKHEIDKALNANATARFWLERSDTYLKDAMQAANDDRLISAYDLIDQGTEATYKAKRS